MQPAPHAARPGAGGRGPVTGVRGRKKGAPAVTEQARLVIGADGKHSLVATAVGARAYRPAPPRSIAFYTYWADVPARDDSPAGTGEIYGRPGCAVGAWPTNDPKSAVIWEAFKPESEPRRTIRREDLVAQALKPIQGPTVRSDSEFLQSQGGIY